MGSEGMFFRYSVIKKNMYDDMGFMKNYLTDTLQAIKISKQ